MENARPNNFKKPSGFAGGSKQPANKWLDTGLGKLPPQALDLEEAVLGALMIEKDALSAVVDILKPESFYKDAHQKIYGAILTLFANSEPIDMLTVTQQLRKSGEIEIVGGGGYIAELTSRVNSAANIEYHSRIITEHSLKRGVISMASDALRLAYEDTTDVFNLLDSTEQALFSLTESNIRKNYADMSTIVRQALNEMETKKNQEGLTGIPSGFTNLDRLTSGWQPTELIILAARPAMGKCLGKGTKVVMFDGSLRKVEDVREGDLLMGDDSTPRRVLSLARGREMMYWVRQNKGIDYRVNESHILSLKRNHDEESYSKGDIINISVRDYLLNGPKIYKYYKGPEIYYKQHENKYSGYKVAIEFQEHVTELNPYFAGRWLGAGLNYRSIRKMNYITDEFINYMGEYSHELNEDFAVSDQLMSDPNLLFLQKYVEDQAVATIKTGLPFIIQKKIPNNYLINSTENRLEILAGLIDSAGIDGGFGPSYVIHFTHTNQALSQQVKYLCDTLGFRTSLETGFMCRSNKDPNFTHTSYEKIEYRLRIFGNLDIIPVRIARKQARPLWDKADWRVTGITVEADKVDEYYGFTINGNHLFLLEDMTVTHNTAFVVSALRNAAVDHGKPVAIFSLEMSSVQLVNRLISAEAEIDSEKIRKGTLAPHEWQQLHHKIQRLTEAPIFIDDTPALSILELRAKCRRLKAQHDIQMVVIDYLQLMSGDTSGRGGGGNREQEIASISRALKNLAKELNVPVIALSQLSRAVETRGGDKKPQLSDLRESGSIEQDADMVCFLYRPEYYNITQDEAGNSTQGIGEVIIAKNRSGSLDTIQLRFIAKYTKFCDLDSYFEPVAQPGFSNDVNGLSSFDTPGGQPQPGAVFKSKANNLSNFGNTDPNEATPF